MYKTDVDAVIFSYRRKEDHLKLGVGGFDLLTSDSTRLWLSAEAEVLPL